MLFCGLGITHKTTFLGSTSFAADTALFVGGDRGLNLLLKAQRQVWAQEAELEVKSG